MLITEEKVMKIRDTGIEAAERTSPGRPSANSTACFVY